MGLNMPNAALCSSRWPHPRWLQRGSATQPWRGLPPAGAPSPTAPMGRDHVAIGAACGLPTHHSWLGARGPPGVRAPASRPVATRWPPPVPGPRPSSTPPRLCPSGSHAHAQPAPTAAPSALPVLWYQALPALLPCASAPTWRPPGRSSHSARARKGRGAQGGAGGRQGPRRRRWRQRPCAFPNVHHAWISSRSSGGMGVSTDIRMRLRLRKGGNTLNI
jgi:hypothetical protein